MARSITKVIVHAEGDNHAVIVANNSGSRLVGDIFDNARDAANFGKGYAAGKDYNFVAEVKAATAGFIGAMKLVADANKPAAPAPAAAPVTTPAADATPAAADVKKGGK